MRWGAWAAATSPKRAAMAGRASPPAAGCGRRDANRVGFPQRAALTPHRMQNTRTAAAIPARWRHVQRCPATSAPGAGRPEAARQPVRARSLAPDHPAPAPATCPVPAADTPAQRPPAAAAPMIPAGRGCAARRRRRPRPTGTARTAGSRRC
ncbi:hypothetical protein G6F54_013626 [Rhizopus delemar]|nr:hypothetical protein G6F54_013626 [Rhizopus delemar]